MKGGVAMWDRAGSSSSNSKGRASKGQNRKIEVLTSSPCCKKEFVARMISQKGVENRLISRSSGVEIVRAQMVRDDSPRSVTFGCMCPKCFQYFTQTEQIQEGA